MSIWRNVLPAGSSATLYDLVTPGWDPEDHGFHEARSEDISSSFGVRITEALALQSAGMPATSFSLVFDGDGIPDRSAQVFEIVKRDAAWQAALDQWCIQNSVTRSTEERRDHSCYIFEALPQAVGDMIEGRSIVRCNFPIGGSWDVEQVLEQSRVRNYDEWLKKWNSELSPKSFQTSPPLPKWIDLRPEQLYTEQ